MKLLQSLIAWAHLTWSVSQASARVPKAAQTAGLSIWTDQDKRTWSSFLSSETGKRLMARFGKAELANYQSQCGEPTFAAHGAGRARGFSDAREWLESLSRVTGVQVTTAEQFNSENDSPRVGEPDLAERYSP